MTCNSPQVASSLFFKYNNALGPPYRVLVDTNFINFSIMNKIELIKGMMDCLYAKSETSQVLIAFITSMNRYSVHFGLCFGGIGEIGSKIPRRFAVRFVIGCFLLISFK